MDIDGFFSYAHNDNIHSCLSRLKTDLCDEYKFITGSALNLYIDEERLSWGDKWKESIRSKIDGSLFFIPVLSPNYFSSGNCVMELQQYLEKARRFEAKELLLPLLLSDIRDDTLELNLDSELVNEVLKYQYRDIRRIRFCERGSAEYNTIVNGAMLDLARANQKLLIRSQREIDNQVSNDAGERGRYELPTAHMQVAPVESEDADTKLGDADKGKQRFLLDDNIEFNMVVEKLSKDLVAINELMTSMSEISNRHGKQLSQDKNLRPSEVLARVAAYSAELQPKADEYSQLADRYLAHTNEADVLMPSVVAALGMSGAKSDKTVSDFKDLIENAKIARTQMENLRSTLKSVKQISRVLYRPLNSIEKSTSICMAAIETTIDWVINFA